MKKKALVLTYHVKNSTRVGGFHHFIKYLIDDGYDVDWVTVTMSSTWMLKHNDKENIKNFLELWKGIEYDENGSQVRHFACPVWIPAKVAKMFRMKLGWNYWPKWKNQRKKLKNNYDVILVEGSACQYAKELRRDYPQANIIYRPSDILPMFSDAIDPEALEKDMINLSDITLCVDENSVKYYRGIAGNKPKIEILRNPITTEKDISIVKGWIPKREEELYVLYIGVSYIDKEIVEYAAKNNKNAKFIMVGPLDGQSHDNVQYTGTLTEEQYRPYLETACIGINPLNSNMIKGEKGMVVGYTRKIINYMKYLMPVVATCSSNYLNIDGFFCVDTKDEFSAKISECLKYSMEDREKLREGYLKTMKIFSEEESRKQFLKLVHGEDDDQ